MKNIITLLTVFAFFNYNIAYTEPIIAPRIVIPKPQEQQCTYIQGVGNPINLLRVLIDVLNNNLSSNSNAQVTLIYQNSRNQLFTFVFRMQTYQSVDYIVVVYRDGYNQGAVIHQLLTEDISLVNRAFGLNIRDNGTTVYCPDIICSWNGSCTNTNNTTNCQNCPNCPGCQTVPAYCNQCPFCNGCPRARNGGAPFGNGGVFVLGASAPEDSQQVKQFNYVLFYNFVVLFLNYNKIFLFLEILINYHLFSKYQKFHQFFYFKIQYVM